MISNFDPKSLAEENLKSLMYEDVNDSEELFKETIRPQSKIAAKMSVIQSIRKSQIGSCII